VAVTNPAKLSSIRQEFNGPNNFQPYNRGGAYVPHTAPSQISIHINGLAVSQFNGVSNAPVIGPHPNQPPSYKYAHYQITSGQSATCSVSLGYHGNNTWALSATGSPTVYGNVLTGVSNLDDYLVQMYLTNYSGTYTNSYNYKDFPGVGSVSATTTLWSGLKTSKATFHFYIKNKYTNEVVYTRNITLEAEISGIA